jgi:carbonic anhydrase
MNLLKLVLLLASLAALGSSAEPCPWNHIGFKTKGLKSCGKNITFELIPVEGQYVQIPYDVNNVNLTTPYNLSIMNVTINGVSTIYPSASYHIHHKAKHIIDGELADFEMHLIHEIPATATTEKKSSGVAIIFKAYPGDFPDPFDHWNLDTKVPILQDFPVKLKTPVKSYHYEGIPGCAAEMMFFIDEHIVRIKKSNMKKVAKLIDATNPPRKDDGSFIDNTPAVCTVTVKPKKWKAIHHLRAE